MLGMTLLGCGGGTGSDDPAASAAAPDGRAQAMASKSPVPNSTLLLTTIAVRAKTTLANDVGALIKLRYNGKIIASAELRSTETTDLLFRVNTVIDAGTLDVVFTNATYANGTVARELTVSGVIVNGTPFAWYSPGVVYDTGHYAEAWDGLNVLPATDLMTMTGALRFPMAGAEGLGPAQAMDASLASPTPGLYVDAWGGSDTYTGTRDRPYRTLARVAMEPMMPGESINFRCGSVWRETLVLTNSNLSDGTRLQPYGDCATNPRPVITGGQSFNGGWSVNGSMWVRDVPAGTPKISRLLMGFTALRTAQWPNVGAPPASAAGGSANALVVAAADAATLAGRDLGDASLMVRTHTWHVEERRLVATGISGQSLPITVPATYLLQAGVTYVLRDKAWMLDAPGEFFHDTQANKLYVIPPSADAGRDPNSLVMEGAVRGLALDMRDRRHLVIQGLALRMTRGDGLRMTNTPDALISDIEATDHAGAGVRLAQWNSMPDGARGPTLQNSFVSGNGEFGVDARYTPFARIANNRVMDIGMADYTGNVDSGVASGPGGVVENNSFDNIGFSAIRFSALQGGNVADNEIRNYCQRLSDCGAIYTWTGTPNHPQAGGVVVQRNRIHPAQAVTTGSVPWGHDGLFGIYIDDYSNGVTVRDNFVHGTQVSVFVHNAGYVTVQNNRLWMPERVAVAVDMDATNFDFAIGINVQGNEIVPYTSTSGAFPNLPTFHSVHAFSMVNFVNGEAALADGRVAFRNNRVVQLHGENAEHARLQSLSGSRTVTAAQWRALNPQEPAIEQPIGFASYWTALGPELLSGGGFDTGLGGWGVNYNWQLPGFAVTPVGGQPGCNGPCIRLTTAAAGDMLFSPDVALRSGKVYLYRQTAVSSGPPAELGWPYISRTAWPWDEMQNVRGFQGRSSREIKAGATLKWEALFAAKADANARVNLMLGNQQVPVYLDSVSVREVTMWLASGPSEWVAPVVAARDAARNVNGCGDIGLPADCSVADLNGAAVAFPFVVAANQQRLLLWANSPYRKY